MCVGTVQVLLPEYTQISICQYESSKPKIATNENVFQLCSRICYATLNFWYYAMLKCKSATWKWWHSLDYIIWRRQNTVKISAVHNKPFLLFHCFKCCCLFFNVCAVSKAAVCRWCESAETMASSLVLCYGNNNNNALRSVEADIGNYTDNLGSIFSRWKSSILIWCPISVFRRYFWMYACVTVNYIARRAG